MVLTQIFPADPAALRLIREFVRTQAAKAQLPADAVHDLVLAVSEACVNVVRHTPSQEVRVRWMPLPNGVAVEVKDTGVFQHRPPVGREEGGYGIPVMLGLVDEFSIRQGQPDSPGTVVRLVKRASPGKA